MQVTWPKMRNLKLLDAFIDYDFIDNYTTLNIEAEEKNNTLWKFSKDCVTKKYRNKRGQYITDHYWLSDLKKSNKANSYRKFFSRLTKKIPEVLVW